MKQQWAHRSAAAGVSRGPLVGRDRELGRLVSKFEEASISCRGSLAMIVGEPGIGKTFLCEYLAAAVENRGGQALFGHCYEEGSLSLPYLAFVELLRGYALSREAADLAG